MWCEITKIKGSWREVANEARVTIGLPIKDEAEDVSSAWKRLMLLSEHSPIRLISVKATWLRQKKWAGVTNLKEDVI